MSGSAPLLRAAIRAGYPERPVLRDVEFDIREGEIVGLAGESGSGKSTIALSLMRLIEFKGGATEGTVWFGGRNLLELSEREMRQVRGRDIALVQQSPLSSLNPAMTVEEHLSETWRAHRKTSNAAAPTFLETLAAVRLDADSRFLKKRPSQMSVGQAQRVMIAMAILHRPRLLIADEATSALDALTASEVLALFSRLSRELGIGILYISHDLLSVASICRRVAVLHEGRIVEFDDTAEIFRRPRHPYTRALLGCMPRLAFDPPERATAVGA